MPVKVHIPTPLRSMTSSQAEVEVEAGTVAELVQNLDRAYKGLKEKLLDERGEIRRYVNIYVNEEDIRFLEGVNTPLADRDVVSIVPAIAGGR